ncbi:MAG: hypothetical protein AVDCRST_MAG06-3220, partial [uncultured Nocardioides sp.]
EPAAQLPLRRPRQGGVVVAARGAAQAPRRLPDAGQGPLLLRPLLRPRTGVVRLPVPRCAGRAHRRRGVPGLPVPPRGGGPHPRDPRTGADHGVAAGPGGARLVVLPLHAQARDRPGQLRGGAAQPPRAPRARPVRHRSRPLPAAAASRDGARRPLRRPGGRPAGVPRLRHRLPGHRPPPVGEQGPRGTASRRPGPVGAPRLDGPSERGLGTAARRRHGRGEGQAFPAGPAGALPPSGPRCRASRPGRRHHGEERAGARDPGAGTHPGAASRRGLGLV